MSKLEMQTYVKKPIEIKAIQFDYGDILSYEDAVFWRQFSPVEITWESDRPFESWLEIKIETSEGTMRAKKGDWIIKGIDDEICPCADSFF